ncbi:MAG: hypothetical protein WDO24_14245 [Pseudomonadota bacterium]
MGRAIVMNSSSLRLKAAEIRKLAGSAASESARWQLAGIAERFERLAAQLEKLQHRAAPRLRLKSPVAV